MIKDTGHAEWSMQSEIVALWQICFEEKREAIDLFFAHRFRPEHTLVSSVNGRVAAMLHMLPGAISTRYGPVPAHYIYAAATDPALRAQGLMGELMERAAQVGVARGDHYSFLLPANPALYKYYGKHGYLPFFQTNFRAASRDELAAKVGSIGAKVSSRQPSPRNLTAARNAWLEGRVGSAVWGEEALDYAVRYAKLYGGQLIVVEIDGSLAYALCSGVYEAQCEVLEFVTDDSTERYLLAAMLSAVRAESYRFRLPADRPLPDAPQCNTHFGMIKPLTATAQSSLTPAAAGAPYLGLTLD